MTLPPPASGSHSVLNITVDPSDLKQVTSFTHSKKPLGELELSDVKPLVFGDEHVARLRMDIHHNGVGHPVILFKKRLYGDVAIVDGCTRALLAIEMNIIIPAELHFCFCLTTYVNPNSVCAHVKESIQHHKAAAAATGWKNDAILGV